MSKKTEAQIDRELNRIANDKSIKLKQPKTKEETEMKTIKVNQTTRTIITVVITLAVVASYAFTFVSGMNHQRSMDQATTQKVEAAVSAVQPSKQ